MTTEQQYKVINCSDCPMAIETMNEHSTFFKCRLSTASMILYEDDQFMPEVKPPPDNCPLKIGNVIIQLD